jgi:hypothetical protein
MRGVSPTGRESEAVEMSVPSVPERPVSGAHPTSEQTAAA